MISLFKLITSWTPGENGTSKESPSKDYKILTDITGWGWGGGWSSSNAGMLATQCPDSDIHVLIKDSLGTDLARNAQIVA